MDAKKRSDSEVLAQIRSDVAKACRQSTLEQDKRDAEHREWMQTRIKKYTDEIVAGIKSGSIIRGRIVETELYLATKSECELVAKCLNVLFPGAKWRHFFGHVLCGVFQGMGCDCSWTRQGCYHGVCCDLESLLASAEEVVQFASQNPTEAGRKA